MYSDDIKKIIKRIQKIRLDLMIKNPFFAVLLMHMKYSIDPMCETAYTDGKRIAFCPDFVETLTDGELEFVLMHEVLHVALNHCGRTLDTFDMDDFNKACDIVVNSNILYSSNMDLSKISLHCWGESMHIAPDGKEGYNYTAEEVYRMIVDEKTGKSDKKSKGQTPDDVCGLSATRTDGGFDDHTYWDDSGGSEELARDAAEEWLQIMKDAAEIARIAELSKDGKTCGKLPLGVERIIKELTDPQIDWRTVLDSFVQTEITDYSFNPPDRRFDGSPFLLPDFNEKDDETQDILFMIDTSGSMSDEMIGQAYSEIHGAIMQFNGKLKGWLGFFDAMVIEPKEFIDESEFKIIKPLGGGGTDFSCVFDYVRDNINRIKPASIVILTDGIAPWPEEDSAMGIPVLWVINNDMRTPPWGKVARIKNDQ